MVSQQMINIIIKAENQAEEQFQKVKEQVDKIGDAGKNAFDNVSKNSENTRQKMGQLGSKLEKTVENVNKLRRSYYKYYTGNDLDNINNYDLVFNSDKLSIEEIAREIKEAILNINKKTR